MLALATLALALASPGALAQTIAFPEQPKLIAVLSPDNALADGADVGGELLLKIQLLSKRPYEALSLDLPDAIPGAAVRRVMRPRTRHVRSYAGEGYVFETALALYPLESGTLRLPSFGASGAVAGIGKNADDVPFDVATEAVDLAINGIDPAMAGEWWMVSTQVSVSEELVRIGPGGLQEPVPQDGANVRDGDIVRRTVTISAAGVPAEGLPRVEHKLGRGFVPTLVASEASTKVTETGVVGTLVRTWDLKVGGRAVAYVSPVAVAYWHPVQRERLTAGVPGKRWEPLPPDRAAQAAVLMTAAEDAHRSQWIALVAVLGLASVPVAVFGLAWLWQSVPSRADRALSHACRASAEPKDWLRAADTWAAAEGVDPRHVPAYRRLRDSVFAPASTAAPRFGELVGALRRASRTQRSARFAALLPKWFGWLVGQPRNL